MNDRQREALRYPRRFIFQMVHPRYSWEDSPLSTSHLSIDAGYNAQKEWGGPVWLGSCGSTECVAVEEYLSQKAKGLLDGVGDAAKGEWTKFDGTIAEVVRRLSEEEERIVGGLKDLRGTWEGEKLARNFPEAVLDRTVRELMRLELDEERGQ